ncbi:MAG: efflux RND transporter periplasmic adaptor subunit [Firmicutes bacterium]|nr:efflux RND transporter periplasmic adaptor subunit [Bacillota bacterium]
MEYEKEKAAFQTSDKRDQEDAGNNNAAQEEKSDIDGSAFFDKIPEEKVSVQEAESFDGESAEHASGVFLKKNTENEQEIEAENTGRNDPLKMRDSAEKAGSDEAQALIPEIREGIAHAKEEMPKWGIGGKIFLLIIAALIVLCVVRIVQLQSEVTESEEKLLTNVKIQQAAVGSVEITTPIAGRIEARDEVNVIPLASGEVTSVNVKEGDHVAAGAVLFTIDDTPAKLNYDQALLSIKTLESTIETLEKNVARTRTLYEAGAVAKSDLESLEDQVTSTENQLEQAKLSAKQAEQGLDNHVVTAPSSGYVTAVNVTVGGPASSAQPAVSISDTSVLELNANVSEYLISTIKVGAQVDVYIEAASEDPFKGRITEVGEAPKQGTYTYPVTIMVQDSKNSLKAGMFAEVRLISARKQNVIAIPSDAVVTVAGEKVVAVVNNENVISFKNVTVGVDNGTVAEITSGISRGETIVIKGQTYVKEGETVNIVNTLENR